MGDRNVCGVCGSTEFTNHAGYYYCSECQTQSQVLREVCLDEEGAFTSVQHVKTKKVRSDDTPTNIGQLTSVQGYTYILKGLGDELINLGAKDTLSKEILDIWTAYLIKLEVINSDSTPKLGVKYAKKDAQVIYGLKVAKRHRKRQKTSGDDSEMTDGDSHVKKARRVGKIKRAVINREHEQEQSRSSFSSDMNQSLHSLRSDSDTSGDERPIEYNSFAKQEMLKFMSLDHLQREHHLLNATPCHKTPAKMVSRKYLESMFEISRFKIYCIVYLALRLIDDDIQLGDMIRFIREGHLSYYSYKKFFPEDLTDEQINEYLFLKGNSAVISQKMIRHKTCELAKLLDINIIPIPNLKKLCVRYCKELNLPDQFCEQVTSLMYSCPTGLEFRRNSVTIPHYEGRVMGYILFYMKFLFGLDGSTENQFSNFAAQLNEIKAKLQLDSDTSYHTEDMFSWDEWKDYIIRRELIVSKFNFPSAYLNRHRNPNTAKLYVQFLKSHRPVVEQPSTVRVSIVNKLLSKLDKLHCDENVEDELFDLKPCITSMQSYCQELLLTRGKYLTQLELDTLQTNFSEASLKYLLKPKKYLEILPNYENIKIVQKGATSNFQYVHSPIQWKKSSSEARKRAVMMNISFDLPVTENGLNDLIHSNNSFCVNSDYDLNSWKNYAFEKYFYKQNHTELDENDLIDFRILKKLERRNRGVPGFDSSWIDTAFVPEGFHNKMFKTMPLVTESLKKIAKSSIIAQHIPEKFENEYTCHYMPEKKYWLRLENLVNSTPEKYIALENSLPESFKFVLKQCSKVIEVTCRDLMEEFMDVEIYQVYIRCDKKPIEVDDTNSLDNYRSIKYLIKKTQRIW